MASPPTKSTSTSIALMLMQLVLPFLVHIHVNCFEINVDVGECNQDQLLPPTASMRSICTRYGLFCVERVLWQPSGSLFTEPLALGWVSESNHYFAGQPHSHAAASASLFTPFKILLLPRCAFKISVSNHCTHNETFWCTNETFFFFWICLMVGSTAKLARSIGWWNEVALHWFMVIAICVEAKFFYPKKFLKISKKL